MAIEVINLVSDDYNLDQADTPPPAKHQSRPKSPLKRFKHGDEVDRRDPIARADAWKNNESRAVANNDLFFDTDDFDMTGDLDGHDIDTANGPASKRARVSDRPATGTRSHAPCVDRAHSWLMNDQPPHRTNTAVETIKLSSSPPACTDTKIPNSDLFSLSPTAQRTSRSLVSRPRAKDNDTVSLKVASGREAKTSTSTAWDSISSSAPTRPTEDNSFKRLTRVFQRSRSEAITIDDEDSDRSGPPGSESGLSDDDLPDFATASLTRPKLSVLGGDLASLTKSAHRANVAGSASTITKKISNGATQRKTAEKRAREEERKIREREMKAATREAEKLQKVREREKTKQEKALARERAAAIAEVNKVRTDKKISTPEMIVDLPSTLSDSTKLQAKVLLTDLQVESAEWTSPVNNVVKWRRKVRAAYNDNLGRYEPIPERIDQDEFVLVVISAIDFVDLALGDEGSNIEMHFSCLKRHFPSKAVIYLIEGLQPWMRKNRTIRNRQFVSAVRAGLDPHSALAKGSSNNQAAPQRRRNTPAAQQRYVEEDAVEDALLELQVLYGALIHHVNVAVETAQWIAIFTQHISTVPYRRQRDADNAVGATFCMESGQVRTGNDAKDTFTKMLQQISRVTAPIAYGIASEYPSVSRLVEGFEKEGPLALESVRKSANKDGAISDRCIGQAVSRRLHKIFTRVDEMSADV